MPELPSTHRILRPNYHVPSGPHKVSIRGSRRSAARDRTFLVPQFRENRPTTVFVSGPSRSVVNGVAFAFAEMHDLTPFWLDARSGKAPSDGPDPVSLGWIPSGRLFISESGHGLELGSPADVRTLWTIVRSDEPASVLSQLTDFLRLPELIQEIVSAAAPTGGPKALVAANSERISHLFPQTAGDLRRFLATLTASSLSIVAAHTGPPGPARFAFETVFRVEVKNPAAWQKGTILCEQNTLAGPFSVGRSDRLSDIPGIARVLIGLLGTRR